MVWETEWQQNKVRWHKGVMIPAIMKSSCTKQWDVRGFTPGCNSDSAAVTAQLLPVVKMLHDAESDILDKMLTHFSTSFLKVHFHVREKT